MTSPALDTEPWGNWALDRWAAEELAAHLDRTRPRVIVESGSGSSTVLLAEYAARTGAHVVSLEHHPVFGAMTTQRLKDRGLIDHVDLVQAELKQVTTTAGPMLWYSAPLPDRIDFALIDGPPGTVGRTAALYALMPSLHGDWRVWLDDAARPGERDALALWAGALPISVEQVDLPKGLAVIRPDGAPGDRPRLDASDVAVTVVTGGRADLLARTLASLETYAPGLLESAFVAVLQNGPDPDTTRILDVYGDLWNQRAAINERLPIGRTAAAMLATSPPRPYVLHLEDDWLAATCASGWLDRARTALDDPRIGQVRLRHRGDLVLGKHMVTRKRIDWQPGPDGHVVGHAHYTLNPSLMRSADTPQVWEAADGEAGAQRRFNATGLLTAQAVPGVFQHLGDTASLRLGHRP